MTMLSGVLEKLANKATEYVKTQPREMAGSLWEKKFAELIIWECLSVIRNCDGDLDFAIWNIKKHFGVEK